MPTVFAPEPPPFTRAASSRIPKYGVHSAPAYVVGTATSGRPVAAETAFAVSIALPPPRPTSRAGAGFLRADDRSVHPGSLRVRPDVVKALGDGESEVAPAVGRHEQRPLVRRE